MVCFVEEGVRASPVVLSMWPAEIFFTFKFIIYILFYNPITFKFISYVLFYNPTHQTETGTTNGWESTNSKPPGPIIMISQSEILSRSQIIFILQSFPNVCSAFLPGTANYANMLSQKPLSWDTPVCSLGSQWVFHDVLQVPNVLFLQGVPNCTSLYYCMHILCPKFSPSLLTYEPRGGGMDPHSCYFWGASQVSFSFLVMGQ